MHANIRRGTITRRAVLASIASSALAVGFDWSAANATEFSEVDQWVLPRLRTTSTFFTDNFRRLIRWDIASTVRLNALPSSERVQLMLRLDRRLLSVGECVAATEKGERVRLTPEFSVAGNQVTATYSVDPNLAASGARPTIGLPLRLVSIFPDDNIEAPIEPTAELVMSHRRGVTRSPRMSLSTQSTVEGVQPWALVVNPAWANRPVGYQTVPVAVRARSLGPHPAPPGAGFIVISDAEAAPEPEILPLSDIGQMGRELGIRHEYSGNRRATHISFPLEVPVGADNVVRLGWPDLGQRGLPPGSLQTVVRPVDVAGETRPRRRSTPYELIADPATGVDREDG
jgi:hypothetical protein